MSAPMTHQDIATAFESIYKRAREIYEEEHKWCNGERKRLRSACGQIGHVFGRNRVIFGSVLECVICGEGQE